jgi:hypothetical protein
MTPSHFGRAKKRLDCAARTTTFRVWNRPETVERASYEARSEARRAIGARGEFVSRMFRSRACLVGDEMLHRVRRMSRSLGGAVCLNQEVCLTTGDTPHPRVSKTVAWTAVQGFAASRLRNLAANGEQCRMIEAPSERPRAACNATPDEGCARGE